MAIPLLDRPTQTAHPFPPRLRFTDRDVRQMFQAGILTEGPFELIEGDLLYKMGKNEPHIFVTSQVAQWLIGLFGFDFVRTESPLRLNESNVPEPDIVVMQKDRRHYLATGTPPASDARLLIEVSDTTLLYDMGVKRRLYAEAHIPDYWIIDLPGRQVHVHRDPHNGVYQHVVLLQEDATLSPLAAIEQTILVGSLLP